MRQDLAWSPSRLEGAVLRKSIGRTANYLGPAISQRSQRVAEQLAFGLYGCLSIGSHIPRPSQHRIVARLGDRRVRTPAFALTGAGRAADGIMA